MTARTIVRTSGNRKIGPHTVATSRDRSSCPASCGMWQECYGTNPTQSGGTLFDNVERAPGDGPDLIRAIAARRTRAVRLNVVGDFLAGTAVDRAYVEEANAAGRAARERGIPAWSYTHAWTDDPAREKVVPADFPDITVRASCESAEGVRRAHAAGWYATIVVDRPDNPTIGAMIDGRRVILCPAQRHASVTCEDCGACARPSNVVAFARHGHASARAMRAQEG